MNFILHISKDILSKDSRKMTILQLEIMFFTKMNKVF